MRGVLRSVPLVLGLALLLAPAAAGAFTTSVPAGSAVTLGAPSRLQFTVTNTDATDGLSRLVLRFPSGYRVTDGSAPSGWTVEQSPADSVEVSFKTTDEATCTGAIAPGNSLVFGVAVLAPASGSGAPDSLVSTQGEQSCRGVALDPPAALPSWDRLGITATISAAPPIVGVGGVVTATMVVSNLSTVELTDVSAMLSSAGTGSVSGLGGGPSPGSLTLGPGASGSLTWTGRAASAGTLSFSGQAVAVAKNLTSPPAGSATLSVGDLDVSLSVTPEQVVSGQEVEVQMTVTNRGRVRVANVMPSALTFGGTASSSAPSGPSPTSQPALEPGEAATFTWSATIPGNAGETYAFSGWASAEWDSVVSQSATSNQGTLTQQDVLSGSDTTDGSLPLGGGAADGGTAAAASVTPATPTTGGGIPTAVPGATVQFVSVNNDGTSTGRAEFSGNLVRALRILVGWQNLPGTHSQRLELFAPDGSLYQQFFAEFSGTPVETQLSVGGSWITQYSLFGAWRVDVFLDQERMPTTSGVFLLTP